MEKNYQTYNGIIQFDPLNKTKKHERQDDWKRVAMVLLPEEMSDYYAWFIKKRYNLILNRPLRGAHITFINDSMRDICKGLNCDEKAAMKVWEFFKERWDGKEVEITLDLDVRSSYKHWWMIVPEEKRGYLHAIRKEIGLERPFYGLHMSLGYANEKNLAHSKYIVDLCKEFGKEFN